MSRHVSIQIGVELDRCPGRYAPLSDRSGGCDYENRAIIPETGMAVARSALDRALSAIWASLARGDRAELSHRRVPTILMGVNRTYQALRYSLRP